MTSDAFAERRPFAFSKKVHDLAEDILQKYGLDATVLKAIRADDVSTARRALFQLPIPSDKVSWKDLDKVRSEDGPNSLIELVLFMNKSGELRLLISHEINQFLAGY